MATQELADAAEQVVETAVLEMLNVVADVNRVNAGVLAQALPGVSHAHEPTDVVVPTCAFCQRRGNVLAPSSPPCQPMPDDVVAMLVLPACELVLRATAMVVDKFEATHDVACVRREITEPLAAYVQNLRDALAP